MKIKTMLKGLLVVSASTAVFGITTGFSTARAHAQLAGATPLLPGYGHIITPTDVYYIETNNAQYRKVYKSAFDQWNAAFKKNNIPAKIKYQFASTSNVAKQNHEYAASFISAPAGNPKNVEWNILAADKRTGNAYNYKKTAQNPGPFNTGQVNAKENGITFGAYGEHIYLNSALVGFSKKQNVKWQLAQAKLIAEHEMGHALGLDHNESGAQSILLPVAAAHYTANNRVYWLPGVGKTLKMEARAVVKVGKVYIPRYKLTKKNGKMLLQPDNSKGGALCC